MSLTPVTRNFASVTCCVFRDRVVFSGGVSSRRQNAFASGTRRRKNVRLCPALILMRQLVVTISKKKNKCNSMQCNLKQKTSSYMVAPRNECRGDSEPMMMVERLIGVWGMPNKNLWPKYKQSELIKYAISCTFQIVFDSPSYKFNWL